MYLHRCVFYWDTCFIRFTTVCFASRWLRFVWIWMLLPPNNLTDGFARIYKFWIRQLSTYRLKFADRLPAKSCRWTTFNLFAWPRAQLTCSAEARETTARAYCPAHEHLAFNVNLCPPPAWPYRSMSTLPLCSRLFRSLPHSQPSVFGYVPGSMGHEDQPVDLFPRFRPLHTWTHIVHHPT